MKGNIEIKTRDITNLCVKINELFSLFHQVYSLEYEEMIKKNFSHIFREYFGEFRTLDLKEFELLISKSSYRQIAIAFNSISFKCDNPTEIELLDKYSDEILTIFSLNVWFNNFEHGIDEIFKEFPEFKKEFDSKVEKRVINMVSASSMWELFLKASSDLQEKIITVAVRENQKRISGSLSMSKKIAVMKQKSL
jgi:hypothetical protein